MSGKQKELELKRERVKKFLADNNLDAVILSLRPNFSWYLCGAHNHVNSATQGGVASLVVEKNRHCLLASVIESPRMLAEETDWIKDLELFDRVRETMGESSR